MHLLVRYLRGGSGAAVVLSLVLASTLTAAIVNGAPTDATNKGSGVVHTIDRALALFANGPVAAHSAALQLGKHLVDDSAMEITFTPRDRDFSAGSAVREWHKQELAVIVLDVAPRVTLKYAALRDAFGPFKLTSREHPGDDTILVAHPSVGESGTVCQISVTLRGYSEHPTGDEPVSQISLTR